MWRQLLGVTVAFTTYADRFSKAYLEYVAFTNLLSSLKHPSAFAM